MRTAGAALLVMAAAMLGLAQAQTAAEFHFDRICRSDPKPIIRFARYGSADCVFDQIHRLSKGAVDKVTWGPVYDH